MARRPQDDQPVDGSHAVLVLPRPGTEADAAEAARLDLTTGLLTPTTRTWRHRPVVVDRKAHAFVRGRKDGVDLAVERANGWRVATVPLVEVLADGVVVLPADLTGALADALDRLAPYGADDVVTLLRAQSRYLRHDGGPVHASPLARKVPNLLDRIVNLGL
jgi:hypothetical protein